ncbi:bifunctional methylenetetrahydrofolate dehydrogenase/methenyltetrahydrofolate cyclohydrolase FolD [Pseudonocardia sp.]|uniref:bifunctional methylenetetrahydrofolate dehydrogenase/methenyltetrahydrofolate cyclohydrolase FolD n=1 Tax=Pseudonocardia sp. TaxID=60912 RepID=UPI003D13B6A2
MTATVIDGREIARDVRSRAAAAAERFRLDHGRVPGLATVLVGDDQASAVYIANKRRSAAAAGIADFHEHLDADASEAEVAAVLDTLAADDRVSGILLQLPLPGHLDQARLIDRIPPAKDVDGLTTLSQGLLAGGRPGLRPCTPSGVIELLDAAGVPLAGARAVVVGRSVLVGRPMAQLLLQRDATVTVAHSRTADLAGVTAQADILIAAAGVQGIITGRHVRAGAAVIDVGIHRTGSGLAGDVDFDDVVGTAGWITPVPGGVGPLTIAMLLTNTVAAATAAVAGSAAHTGVAR